MTLSCNFSWSQHISELVSALNSRLFMLRRLTHHLPAVKLVSVVHGLILSKIRYGVPLYGQVQLSEGDPRASSLRPIEVVLNSAMRTLTGNRKEDRKSIRSLHEDTGLPSLNQITAGAILQEVWKIQKGESEALEDLVHPITHTVNTKSKERGYLKCIGKSRVARKSFQYQAANIWNNCDSDIKQATSLNSARLLIKRWADSLPL